MGFVLYIPSAGINKSHGIVGVFRRKEFLFGRENYYFDSTIVWDIEGSSNLS